MIYATGGAFSCALPCSTRRFSDDEISQSCIYRITQNRASNYLTHTHARRRGAYPPFIAPDIVAADIHRRIICISVARSGRCPVVDIRERDNWFGSAISFARSPRYVSRYASSVVRRRRDGDSTSRFNIREKRAGRLLTDDRYATPSSIFTFVFPSTYLFCKLSRRPSACVVPPCIIMWHYKKKEDDWVIALRDSADLHRVYLSLYFFLLLYELLIIVIFVINLQIKGYDAGDNLTV